MDRNRQVHLIFGARVCVRRLGPVSCRDNVLMSVQDRMKEHAVLQVLGMRPWRVFRIVLTESVLLCVVGGSLGTLIGLSLLSWGGLAIGAEGVTIAFRPSANIAISAMSVSVAIGVLAGIIPAVQTARVVIDQVLRDS